MKTLLNTQALKMVFGVVAGMFPMATYTAMYRAGLLESPTPTDSKPLKANPENTIGRVESRSLGVPSQIYELATQRHVL